MRSTAIVFGVVASLIVCPGTPSVKADDPQRLSVEPSLIHLRSGAEQEWTDFPEASPGSIYERSFLATKNSSPQTLILRQQDVKQAWTVSLNKTKLGELVRDENDMVVMLAIPTGTFVDGQNVLKIEPAAGNKNPSDDIRLGQIAIDDRSPDVALSESSIDVEVRDHESNLLLPCRITLLNANGALQTIGTTTNDHLAVRQGVVYTTTGQAKLSVPAGHYTIYAGRGFEYSLAKGELSLEAGEFKQVKLVIRREVPTAGYVACDTHVHTLTHSGHGDATIEERMITLAGEGIELPIATDHNKHIDYQSVAVKCGVRQYFTPIIGNEVTTPRGHFNIFPVNSQGPVVDHTQTDWTKLFDQIDQTPGVKAKILNHARDLHSGFRPFSPVHHNAVVGENLDGWPQGFTAMEVINSGATQSDPLQLCHDWMGLLNHGLSVTPVGSSDSHDVSRFIVGQGRTYIRSEDQDPGMLDTNAAITSFIRGQVMVSYGLIAELMVNETARSGDLVTDANQQPIQVDVRVLGPHWVTAQRVQLYANGRLIRDGQIPDVSDSSAIGVKWTGHWTIEKPSHDVHLVAIATGPGVRGMFWPMAKPYQPVTRDGSKTAIGCSGAVWLDIDGDGKPTSARETAQRFVTAANGDWPKCVESLRKGDAAVAAQAAHLIHSAGGSLESEAIVTALKASSQSVQSGFLEYQQSVRESQIAKSRPE